MTLAIYLAGPSGFTEPGRRYHEEHVIPAVRAAGFDCLDPWAGAAPRTRAENRRAGRANQAMIDACAAVLAILDGPDVDSGTAAEIGYAAAIGRPVVGLRTDIRMSGENRAALVNLQVAWFVEHSGGTIVTTLPAAVAELEARAVGRDA
jgi:nucleoside 2-deoxyribosyltransferase